MKLVVVVIEKERQPELIELLRRTAVTGYSVIPSVFGAGETGAHFGTRTFPGENALIMALVTRPEFDRLGAALRAFGAGLRSEEAFKVLALEAESVI